MPSTRIKRAPGDAHMQRRALERARIEGMHLRNSVPYLGTKMCCLRSTINKANALKAMKAFPCRTVKHE